MNNRRDNNGRPGYGNGNNYARQTAQPKEIIAERVPVDYVEEAEKVMESVLRQRPQITTSKIRKILALAMEIYNSEYLRQENELLLESVAKLQMMRVRVLYECGRDAATKSFVEAAQLIEYMKGIGKNRETMIAFTHYVEALVAYHRYLGGKEG